VVAAALVPLTVAPFAAGSVSPTIDAVLISLILIHSHIGFESVTSPPCTTFTPLTKYG